MGLGAQHSSQMLPGRINTISANRHQSHCPKNQCIGSSKKHQWNINMISQNVFTMSQNDFHQFCGWFLPGFSSTKIIQRATGKLPPLSELDGTPPKAAPIWSTDPAPAIRRSMECTRLWAIGRHAPSLGTEKMGDWGIFWPENCWNLLKVWGGSWLKHVKASKWMVTFCESIFFESCPCETFLISAKTCFFLSFWVEILR